MRLTISVLITFSTAILGLAADHKLSAELRGIPPGAAVDVIVKYRQAPTAEHHGRIAARGGELKQSLEIIHGDN
jgi:hypothetical protein